MVKEISHSHNENKYTREMLKVIGTQIHKRNTLPESESNNYQITITILLLYHLICELDYRIDSSRTTSVFNGLIIALAKVMAIVHQPEKFHWKVFFFCLSASFIRDYRPNALPLDSEFDLSKTHLDYL